MIFLIYITFTLIFSNDKCNAKILVNQQIDQLLPKPGICGKTVENYTNSELATKIGEFPWLTKVEIIDPSNPADHQFICGGMLINNRYVITAAHCLNRRFDGKNILRVKLGDWDFTTEIDCIGNICADPPMYSLVEEIIPHNDYNSTTHQNDIALLRLASDVQYTEWISPICLPIKEHLHDINYTDVTLTVAGWGLTQNGFSEVKLKGIMTGISNDKCNTVIASKNVHVNSKQLCAGGNGFVSCSTDSGGPLMAIDLNSNNNNQSYWYAVGVVSYGVFSCEKTDWPYIQTRMSQYLDFISKNIH